MLEKIKKGIVVGAKVTVLVTKICINHLNAWMYGKDADREYFFEIDGDPWNAS